MIKWIWAKSTGGRLVYFLDFDGEETTSIAYKNHFGILTAQRHWPFRIRIYILNDDGSVIGDTYFVRKWKFK